MGKLGNSRVCGEPAEHNFLTQVRPDLGGRCPTGFLPCNADAMQVDNVVCVQESDPASRGRSINDRCPILDLVLRDKAKQLDEAYFGWQVVDLDSRYELRFTKTGDQLPLTTF